MSYALNRAFRALRGMANVDAELAGRVISDIATRSNGTVTPRLLVEESRTSDAPLHSFFEWDDSVAGEKYRENQARYILRAVVKPMEVEGKMIPVRAFINLQAVDSKPESDRLRRVTVEPEPPDPRAYHPIDDVLDDKELRAQMVKQAIQELKAWEDRYRLLKEFAVVRLAAARVYSKYE